MLDDAETFIARWPSDVVGVLFLEGDKPVQPDLNAPGRYRKHEGARDIGTAMLERYGEGSP
jgi:hypothetical protein